MTCTHNDCFTCPYPDCIVEGRVKYQPKKKRGRKKLSPEVLAQHRREYYEKNKEKYQEYYRKYYQEHKSEYRAREKNLREKEISNGKNNK